MKDTYRIGIDVRLMHETGVGRYIRNLLRQLAVIDTKNTYVLFAKSKNVSELQALYKNTNWKIVATDIHWHTISEQLTFSSLLEKEHLDLIHFPYFSLPIRYKKPFVVTIHDLIIHHFPTGKASTLPLPLYMLKHIGYKKILRHGVNQARNIIVPLNAVKNDLIKTLSVSENKITVTPEGFDESIQVTGDVRNVKQLLTDKKYILYVGNAYPHKRVTELVLAFHELQQKRTELYLVLVGKDDYFYRELHEFVKKNDVKHTIFMHTIADNELAYLYQHAIAFVSASRMEGFGLPPLEAMHFSCPLVLPDIPAFREVCQGVPIYFHPEDRNAMIAALEKVYLLHMKENNMQTDKIKNILEHFSWEEMARKTVRVYESSISI